LKPKAYVMLVAVLFMSVFLPSGSAAAATPEPVSVQMTVFPDGSATFGATGNLSYPGSPGTVPAADLRFQVSTSGGTTTDILNATVSVPAGLLNEPPYNSTSSISATGSYSAGVSKGELVVHAVPGVDAPFNALLLNYYGNSSAISVSGNVTLQYGTYGSGFSQTTVNRSAIATDLAMLQGMYLNRSYINDQINSSGFKDLSVTDLSLGVQYGNTTATVSGKLVVKGNMTALPQEILDLEYGCPNSPMCAQYKDLFSSYQSVSMSSVDYKYSLAYSNGLLGLQFSGHAPAGISIDKALKADAKLLKETGAPASMYQFLNSTTFDFSELSGRLSVSQQANGTATTQFQVEGLTVRPSVRISNSTFTESALFNLLGNDTLFQRFTVIGGANSTGTVRVVVPAGVPTPKNTTANSATWVSVAATSLAPLQFVITHPTPASGGGGIPEFPAQLLLGGVVAMIIVVSYIAVRRRRDYVQTGP
jgi:hypothetical protein